MAPVANTRLADTEKITINVGLIDLGQIDLLVQEGFYTTRTDFIRTAIRNQITTHADVVRQTVLRRTLVLGLQEYSKRDLERVRKSKTKLRIQALGLVRIANDVAPSPALDTVESLAIPGAFHATPGVKARLAARFIEDTRRKYA